MFRPLFPGLFSLAALALVAFSPQGAFAEILAEDHFLIGEEGFEDPMAGEYFAPRSRDGGQEGSPGGGDIGLDFQWAVVPGFTTTEWTGNRGEVNPLGMSYAGLASEGGMAHGNPADHGQRFGRPFDSQFRFTSQTEGTYYLSFIMMLNQDGGDWGYRTMELHDGGFDDGSHRKFQLGVHRVKNGNGDFGPGDGGWGVRVNNDNNLRFQFDNQDKAQTEAQLFVIRFDMSTAPGGDSVTVWLNPPQDSFGEEGDPEGGQTLSGFDLTFDRISFASWQTPFWFNPYFGTVFFDEIRLGTSWAAVTPVFEAPESTGDFLKYNFVGSLDGWEQLTVPNSNWGPQRWIGVAAMDARQVESQIPLNPSAAKQYLHVDARFPGGADLSHPTLWMRSPQFRLNGAGDLSFWIMGGGANNNPNAFVPTNESQVPAQSADTVDGGFHGVVLRNVETGEFVMVGNRTNDDFDWQEVVFTADELAALDQNAVYTLDAIDARHNAWAWFNLDSISIPGMLDTGPTGISRISNQAILMNTSMEPRSFTLFDDEIDPALLTVSASSSNTTLVPNGNIVINGTGATRTITLTPANNQLGETTITLTVENGTVPASSSFTVQVVTQPIPPTISNIADQDIWADENTGAIPFRVSSLMREPGELTLTGSSSNTTLVPNGSIVFGGADGNRTVTVTPNPGLIGNTNITVTVSDGATTGESTTFALSVSPPKIEYDFEDFGVLADYGWTTVSADATRYFQVLEGAGQGGSPGSVGMTPADGNQHVTAWVRSPEFTLDGQFAGDLTVWLAGGEDNGPRFTHESQVPANSVSLGFLGVVLRNADTGAFVWNGVKPGLGNTWHQVSISESDLLQLDQNATYTLDFIDARHGGWGHGRMDNVSIPGTLTAPPTGPIVGSIPNQTIVMNTSTGTISFTVGHHELTAGVVTLSGSSSNTTLAPNGNIVFGGSGANRTVTVTPATDRTGSTTITVIGSDGEQTASTTFVVTVVSDAGPVEFNFADGTLGGWTEVGTDGQGRQYFALVPPSVNSPNITPHSGDHFIGLHNPAFDLAAGYTQDGAHDTLIMRSPEFTLNGSGALTAWLSGGGSGSVSLAGTNVASLPAASSTGGFLGVALRNVTTGTFVLSATKSSGGNAWAQVTFTAAQLAGLPQGDVYTLDLIDARHGGWGWVNMDSVSIPGDLIGEPPTPVDEAPRLAIARSGASEVRLSWSVTAIGWILESAFDLSGDFTEVGLEPTVEGEDNVVYDDIVAPKQFYRLVK